MSDLIKRRQGRWASIADAATLVAAALWLGNCMQLCAATTVYYFNYDANSNGGVIVDESLNGHDLGTFSAATFQFAPLSGVPLVGSAQAFDVQNTVNPDNGFPQGGLTDANPISNAQVAAAGGYTYETWIKRTSLTNPATGIRELIWSPEGTHTLEIFPYDSNGDFVNDRHLLQFAFRLKQAFTTDVNAILPIDEWHHIMAVMDMAEDTGAPDDARYSLLVDGTLITASLSGSNPLGPHSLTTGLDLDSSGNPRHGIGWNEFGGPNDGLRGQLAYTRLSLGVVTYAESLAFEENIPGFIPEPSTLALGIGTLSMASFRRTRGSR